MTVLVTGGAGYIGAHMVRCLLASASPAHRQVVVVDDLSTGHAELVPRSVPFVTADVGDRAAMADAIGRYGVESIIHFAARTQVGESVRDPRLYWTGNVAASLALLEAALERGVRRFVFSSSAAVYGVPETVPISEASRLAPVSPYGDSKVMVERILASYASAYGLRYAALRYFNAAGADTDTCIGEVHEPETHLVPLVLDAALGRRPYVTVFGRDYPTADGTCVRDYVHVLDLADAHLAALAYLEGGGESGAFNLGSGMGYSVHEVINTCSEITGREIPVAWGPRRPGDPPALVASPRLAEVHLGWRASRSSIDRIVSDAWAFHLRAFGERPSYAPPGRRAEEQAHAR